MSEQYDGKSDAAKLKALRGSKVAVNTGTLCDQISERAIPDCTIVPFKSNTDLAPL